ncbi:MAG: riboflavin synthase [Rhodospirillaceae bacterium]|jgi:riboflavin synthase|nr:riboflavin synthase [Rhodospirillaceae bacterium]|tara:strand:- start:3098 stop:3694 length:597 start_codon:yes stop_codon:yes gene_type:complete
MFSGIITDLGSVRAIEASGDSRFEFSTGFDTVAIDIGASVCCSGVCLTVIDKGEDWFAANVSAETLVRTTMGDWSEGSAVNFERALKIGDELGGHMVFGHVDGVATAVSVAEEGESRRIVFEAPDGPDVLHRMIAAKGSVAVDGVSLTVNEVEDSRFGVNVIPHTLAATTLGALGPGDRANLEIDMLARYIARLLEGK